MTDNIVKASDVNSQKEKPVKKAPVKKAAAKKVDAQPESQPLAVKENSIVIVFESGSSYTSNGIRFTRQNPIQEVPESDVAVLLELDNFRLANEFEIEDYLNSKED